MDWTVNANAGGLPAINLDRYTVTPEPDSGEMTVRYGVVATAAASLKSRTAESRTSSKSNKFNPVAFE
jgi:hypothetical protein